MKKNILIVPGDGIGQEVTEVGKSVLVKIAEKFGHEFSYDEALMGHVAIEATGNPLPDETLEKMRNSDAILSEPWAIPNMITTQLQKFALNKAC
jgi:3-isopropylmalate dehydrogenase